MLSSKSEGVLSANQMISQIKETVSEFCISHSRNIHLKNYLNNDLGMDSFNMVELSITLEDKIKVYLSKDLLKVKSIKYLNI